MGPKIRKRPHRWLPLARSPVSACDWASGAAVGAHTGTQGFPQVSGPQGVTRVAYAARERGQPSPWETTGPATSSTRPEGARGSTSPGTSTSRTRAMGGWTGPRPGLGEEATGRRVSSTTRRWSAYGSVMTCRPPGDPHDLTPGAGWLLLPRRRRARDASG